MVQGDKRFNKVSIFSSYVPKGCSNLTYMFLQEIKCFVLSKNDLFSKQSKFFKSNLIMSFSQVIGDIIRDSRMLYSNLEYALLAVCWQYYLENIKTVQGMFIQVHFVFNSIIFVFYIIYVSNWSKLFGSKEVIT